MGLYDSLKIDESEIGKTFGKWTQLGASFVIRRTKQRKRHAICQCECGRIQAVDVCNLRSGKTTVCFGCVQARAAVSLLRHGKSKTRVHNIWCGMITRCTNPNVECWNDYGGRGIQVCERWMVFENFYADMGEPPTGGHSIEREKSDGNYEPGNCHWATQTEQARNKRTTKRFNYRGRMLTTGELSEMSGVGAKLIAERLRRGQSVERAVKPIDEDCKKC